MKKIIALALLALVALAAVGCQYDPPPGTSPTPPPGVIATPVPGAPTPYVPPTPVPNNPPPAPQPTAVPPGANPPATAGTLKYDEMGCDANNLAACRPNQAEFPAIYVRNIQSGDRTLVGGIQAIQQLAAASEARTQDKWRERDVDPVNPTFVWCPGNNCQWVPDTAFPLLGIPRVATVAQTIGIVQSHAPADPPARIIRVTCPNADCWSVALR